MMKNKKGQAGLFILIAVIVILFIGLIGYEVAYSFAEGQQKITIEKKWTKIVDGTERYRITTTDKEIFIFEESYLHRRWETASDYVALEENCTYEITYQGWRSGIFSKFKNLVGYRKLYCEI